MIVGMTMAANATRKPTTRIYDRAIGRLRLLFGKILASFFTNGEMARAKKTAAKMIARPVRAAKSMNPAAANPIMTSQKRTKVFVSICIFVVVLIATL